MTTYFAVMAVVGCFFLFSIAYDLAEIRKLLQGASDKHKDSQ